MDDKGRDKRKKRTKINESKIGEWECTKAFKFNYPIRGLVKVNGRLFAFVDNSLYEMRLTKQGIKIRNKLEKE